MPYETNGELPYMVRRNLPTEAQDIFRVAFNHAWHRHSHAGARRGEIANRAAWKVVTRSFHQVGTLWAPLKRKACV